MPAGHAVVLKTNADPSGRMHPHVYIRKTAAKGLAAFSFFAYGQAAEHVWRVDHDIDLTIEVEVRWAMATIRGGAQPLGRQRKFSESDGVPREVKSRMFPHEYVRQWNEGEIGSLAGG